MSGVQILAGETTDGPPSAEALLRLPHLQNPTSLNVGARNSDALRIWEEIPEFRDQSGACVLSREQSNLNLSGDSLYFDANGPAACRPGQSTYLEKDSNARRPSFEVGSFILVQERLASADPAPLALEGSPQFRNRRFSFVARMTAIENVGPQIRVRISAGAGGSPLNPRVSLEQMGFS